MQNDHHDRYLDSWGKYRHLYSSVFDVPYAVEDARTILKMLDMDDRGRGGTA